MLRHKPYLQNVQAAQCFPGCICALSMSHNTSVPARLTAANACTEQAEIDTSPLAIVSCRGHQTSGQKTGCSGDAWSSASHRW
jgi:hypothetical protein